MSAVLSLALAACLVLRFLVLPEAKATGVWRILAYALWQAGIGMLYFYGSAQWGPSMPSVWRSSPRSRFS